MSSIDKRRIALSQSRRLGGSRSQSGAAAMKSTLLEGKRGHISRAEILDELNEERVVMARNR
jgi:hypothetical protein